MSMHDNRTGGRDGACGATLGGDSSSEMTILGAIFKFWQNFEVGVFKVGLQG